ncbi:MAG: hypothetical protein LLF94_05110 [Chlamydiales bacterium]|nr:hypothetical protein [Chlamydiales bacterium]
MLPQVSSSASGEPNWALEPSLPKNKWKLEPYEQLKEYGFRTEVAKDSRNVVVILRDSPLSIDSFIEIISSSALSFVNATPFLTFTQAPRLYPLPNIAERVKLLTEAKSKLSQTCAAYRKTWDFTFSYAETCARYEQQWKTDEGKITKALSFIESIPQQLGQLYHLETTVRTILPQLDTIRSLADNGKFTESDRMNLEHISETLHAKRTVLEDKNTSPLRVLHPHHQKSVRLAVDQVYERSTILRLGIPFFQKFGLNPFEAFSVPASTITNFRNRLSTCLQNGVLDTESMDAILAELLPLIERYHQLFSGLDDIAKKCPEDHLYGTLKNNIHSLVQFIPKLEEEFIFAEVVRLVYIGGIPIKHYGNGLLSLFDSTDKLSDEAAVAVYYYGVIHNTKHILAHLKNEHPLTAKFKEIACQRVIDRTNLFVSQNAVAMSHQRVRHREEVMNRYIATLHDKPTILLQGEKKLLIHRAALQRLSSENVVFFNNLISQTWQDTPTIVLPDTCLWPAVVEFVSWMYGLSSLSSIPKELEPRFAQICDYFAMCDKDLTDKFDPL